MPDPISVILPFLPCFYLIVADNLYSRVIKNLAYTPCKNLARQREFLTHCGGFTPASSCWSSSWSDPGGVWASTGDSHWCLSTFTCLWISGQESTSRQLRTVRWISLSDAECSKAKCLTLSCRWWLGVVGYTRQMIFPLCGYWSSPRTGPPVWLHFRTSSKHYAKCLLKV